MADNFIEYRNNYNRNHYDRFSLMLEVGEKERLQTWAKAHGINSLNKLIKLAIYEYVGKHGEAEPEAPSNESREP